MSNDTAPPAGGDVDSRKRDLKARLAAAEAVGDDKAAKGLRGELDKLRAAEGRATAAEVDPDGAKAPPSGRTSPTKSTTAKPTA